MKREYLLITLLLTLIISNLFSYDIQDIENSFADDAMKILKAPTRNNTDKIEVPKEKLLYQCLEGCFNQSGIFQLKKLLADGANPNYCKGECQWADSDPLSIVAANINNTYLKKINNENTADIPTQELKLLVDAGADINARPYIWEIVTTNTILPDKRDLEDVIQCETQDKKNIDEAKELIKLRASYIQDVDRVLKAFLDAGSDPDKRGDFYPYSTWYQEPKLSLPLTDTKANDFFKDGTRPINETIKKGIAWERQLDLLLQYTKLDEDSLYAAQMSGDPKMIIKINELWKKQNKK